jgi:hypothetical protein
MLRDYGRLGAVLLLAVGASLGLCPALAADGLVVSEPELVIVRQGASETCALPATGYADLVVAEQGASFLLTGAQLPAGQRRVVGRGVRRVSWEPAGDDTRVSIEFVTPPTHSVINAVAGTEVRPYTPQVVVGFGFADGGGGGSYPVLGSSVPRGSTREDAHGAYKLPGFPPVRYSDALVTLRVENVDFRDVLWLMSEIGGVSIVLDPYWADEPTGMPRPVGGGASGDGAGAGEDGGGFRDAGDFVPMAPRSGTGRLSLNFENVPFDTALELILMSVGLVKVDIYPGDLD